MTTSTTVAASQRSSRAGLGDPARIQLLRWGTVVVLVVIWELLARGPFSGSGYLTGPVEIVRDGIPKVLAPEPLRLLGRTTLRFVGCLRAHRCHRVDRGPVARTTAPSVLPGQPRRGLGPLCAAAGPVLPPVRAVAGAGQQVGDRLRRYPRHHPGGPDDDERERGRAGDLPRLEPCDGRQPPPTAGLRHAARRRPRADERTQGRRSPHAARACCWPS